MHTPLRSSRSSHSSVTITLLIVAVVASALLTPQVGSEGSSNSWYDLSFSRRKPITVDNRLNTNSLTDFQVRVEVQYDSDMKPDFSDLRFTDNTSMTLIPYWIEKFTPSYSAVVWAKVPAIAASSISKIYMYYGNSTASTASNGTSTFEFFDDFNGTTLNSNKWTEDAVNDITQTVNNYFRFEDATRNSNIYWIYDGTDRGSQHQAKWTPLNKFALEFTSRINDLTNPEAGQGLVGLVASDNTVIGVAGHQDWDDAARNPTRVTVTENMPTTASGVTRYNNVAYKTASAIDQTDWSMVYNGTTVRFSDNSGFFSEATTSSPVSKLALVAGTDASIYLDYVQMTQLRVRKYASPQPSITVGSEEDWRMKTKYLWWNTAWLYRQPVVITENSGTSLYDYQAKLTVDYVPGKMNPDFSDLRFLDDDQATLIPYWIENYTLSTTATVWVKVPNIPAQSNKTIYMYYGNVVAQSASDGKSTFEFFEDFETPYEGASRWTEKSPLPSPKADPSVAAYNGKLYVFGGYYNYIGDPRRETYEYDPAGNSWTRKADMPTARWGPIAVEYNGKIYVIGGSGVSGSENVNELYDPTNDTWITKSPPLFTQSQGLMAIRYGDEIHIFYQTNHYAYYPATDTYAPKAPVPQGRTWAACALVANRIYLIGGYPTSNINQVYDPATDTWTTKAPMPVSKYGGSRENPVIDGKIYVTHGRDNSDDFHVDNYVYDPLTDSWQQKSPAIYPRAGPGGGIIDGKLYVIGGVVPPASGNPIGLNYNEEYDPATDTWTQSPWTFSNSSKVGMDPAAHYEGEQGLQIYEDQSSTAQFAQHSQSYSTVAVDFYWDVTDIFGEGTNQPQGRVLLADAANPGQGSLYYYNNLGAGFYWNRNSIYTFLENGNWNTWYATTIVWNGANSKVIINGNEHSVAAAQVSSDRIYFGTVERTKMYVDLVRVRKYTSPVPTAAFEAEQEPAIIAVQTCDSVGTQKAEFTVADAVYLKGANLRPSTEYNLYVVNHVASWNNGDPIPTRVQDTVTNIVSDESGNIQPTMIWSSATLGNYDIVIDAYENGFYDTAFDALSNFQVITPPLHDIAVLSIEPNKTHVGNGYIAPLNVTIANQGDLTENINLTLYANSTAIGNYEGTLASASSLSIRFDWSTIGFAKGDYVINASLTSVAGEVNTANNNLDYNGIIVTIPGDVNVDRKVDSLDLWLLGKAYNSEPNKPEWNTYADINTDGIVNQPDIEIVDSHYGQEW